MMDCGLVAGVSCDVALVLDNDSSEINCASSQQGNQASSESLDSADVQSTYEHVSSPRRRLPVPHVVTSSSLHRDSFSAAHHPSHLSMGDRDDNGNIKIVVEMETQVKEKVIGYVPNDHGHSSGNISGEITVQQEDTEIKNSRSKSMAAEPAKRRSRLVGPQVSTTHQQQSSSIPRVGQSVTESSKAQSNTPTRQITAALAAKKSTAMNRTFGYPVTNTVSKQTASESVQPSAPKTIRGTLDAANIGENCKIRSQTTVSDDSRRTQSVQSRFAGSSSKSPSRLLPPALSRLHTNTKVGGETAHATESKSSSAEVNSTSKPLASRSQPEPRGSLVRRSSSSVNCGPSVHTPRKSSYVPDLKYGTLTVTSTKRPVLMSESDKGDVQDEATNGRSTKPKICTQSVNTTKYGHTARTTARKSISDFRLGIPSPGKQLSDTALKLQLSRCTSPSNESQSSVVSEKSSRSSLHTTEQKNGGHVARDDFRRSDKYTHAPQNPIFARAHIQPARALLRRKSVGIQANDERQFKASTEETYINSSSADHVTLPAAHQPDVVTNTICHEQMATARLHQLEKCQDSLEKHLNSAITQLRHRTLGFEAMVVLVKHLSQESCPVTVSRLEAELQSLRTTLVAETAKCDILIEQRNALISEIQNEKEERELEVNALSVTHEMALQSLNERLETNMELRLLEVGKKHTDDIAALNAVNELKMNELKQAHQKEIADKEQDVTSRLIDLEFTHKRKLSELQRKHDMQVKELEQTKAALLTKVDQLKAESERMCRLTSSTQSLTSIEGDSSSLSTMSTLMQEVDSLKVVLDLRNTEVAKLKSTIADFDKQTQELSAAKETIRKLEQKLENAEAIVSMKSDYEKQLAEKHQALLRMYDQESKASKRLSMDKEQLMWRLSNDGTTLPQTPPATTGPPTTPNVVRRTLSNPISNRSAPGTPLVSKRSSRTDKSHRPLSSGDFDHFGPEDFIRDDPEDLEF